MLCAQSPCLHRMKKVMKKMKLYEPAEFIMKYLVDRLDFHQTDKRIALHLTCSTRQMGVDKDMIALAKLCSTNVFLPEGVGCCGFAGDRGFTFPELNKYGLRKLRPQIGWLFELTSLRNRTRNQYGYTLYEHHLSGEPLYDAQEARIVSLYNISSHFCDNLK